MQKFIDESSAGVVLFTFGSIARSSFLKSSVVSIFREVFSQIPQRVIWKYEESIEDLPKNVMVSDWVAQRDILGLLCKFIISRCAHTVLNKCKII